MSTALSATPCEFQPFFIDTPRGPAFAIHHRPTGVPVRGNLLFVPPFNEEMNRCRSMLTLLAQALAEQGYGSLLIDLHGTGDSAGTYVDARWGAWLDDVAIGMRWLRGQPGGCTGLLGIRLGAALAAEALRADAPGAGAAAPRVGALVLWQPVVDGKQHLTQFLRVKIAAQMDRTDLPKETTSTMRAQFAAGQPVEVAGYELHPELAQAMDAVRLGTLTPPPGVRVLWLEQPPPGTSEMAPASATALAAWQQAGASAQWQPFEGPSFWQQYERVVAPDAIAKTVGWLSASQAVAA